MYCGGKLTWSGLMAIGRRREVLLPEKKGRPMTLEPRELVEPGVLNMGEVCWSPRLWTASIKIRLFVPPTYLSWTVSVVLFEVRDSYT